MKQLIVALLFLLSMATGMISCSDIGSGPNKWRYKPYNTMPPSWENDMGRPGPAFTGDTW